MRFLSLLILITITSFPLISEDISVCKSNHGAICTPLKSNSINSRGLTFRAIYNGEKPFSKYFKMDKNNPNDQVVVRLYPYEDLNCNGIQDTLEEFIPATEFFIEPQGKAISGSPYLFEAHHNQTLIFSLTTDQYYKIATDGEEWVVNTGSGNDTVVFPIPLCSTIEDYSYGIGRIYYDENQDKIKNNNESYLSDIRMKAQANGEIFSSGAFGRFVYRNIPGTTTTLALVQPSLIEYELADSPWIVTLPSSVNDTIILGDIPVWDKKKDYGILVDVLNIGSVNQNTDKLHQVNITNTGRNEAVGMLTWTLRNWGSNNFADFSISPDQTIRNGKDFTLVFNNFTLAKGETKMITFIGKLIQDNGTRVDEVVKFTDNAAPDVTDRVTYIIGVPHESNYRNVNPERISQKYIAQQGILHYTINFQNTGDTIARDVYLFDYLPRVLDVNNLEIGSASFPPTFRIFPVGDEHLVVWHFDEINLPPSEQDFNGSNAYLTYQIPMWSDSLIPRDTIETRTEIDFDDRAPIFSDTARTVYYCPQMDGLHFATTSIDTFKCYGDVVTFKLNIDSTYLPLTGQWSDQEEFTLEDRVFDRGGFYTYRLEDEALCTDSWHISLREPDSLTFTVNRTDSLLYVDVDGGTPPYNILWTTDTTFGEYKIIDHNGLYEFTIIDDNGCRTNGYIEVTTLASHPGYYKPIIPFPQPVSDMVSFPIPDRNEYQYQVFNVIGTLVLRGESTDDQTLFVGQLPPGIYTLQIEQEQKYFIGKFIKK